MIMNPLKTGLVWTIVCLLGYCLIGCASTAPTTQEVAAPLLGADLPRVTVPDSPPNKSMTSEPMTNNFSEPSGELTLRQALAAALVNNPELMAYAWENRAREAEALQAGLAPNPDRACWRFCCSSCSDHTSGCRRGRSL